jgi:exodeoxyribonuclease VII small subunit
VIETPEPSFEELQRELAATVARLEQGDVPVDEAIALWRRGEELYRLCVARLEAAELQIEELTAPERPA